ncbi:uncharacterized protein DUF4397 [Lentzea atacamensis]|uniref:Uncharacterized protein DUF4397 n=1 Tax=Lentzea atacamensis TaxID=531938 RepID=A0A316HM95_9PSEU|nr:DUF4397 domain-containing protein [Lentzea atacamensis]PWK81440.1 uncharacterized protein DUF4397 [Lentzea atacamensis]RAS70587.1 uncharacterized protein DUF4397 [Lentzea atacamensis]
MRVLAVVVLLLLSAAPAHAATGTYVRLGHFSADHARVDATLDGVRLGTLDQAQLYDYRRVEQGDHVIEFRIAGSDPGSPVLRSVGVRAGAGRAYTVIDIASAMKVLEDDVSLPPSGQARLRVINAGDAEMDLVRDGGFVHRNVQANSTTGYALLQPGSNALQVLPRGKDSTRLEATIESGAVYTLLVSALRIELRTDAKGAAVVPGGGQETGFGGMAGGWDWVTALVIALIVGVAMFSVRGRLFRFG